MKQPLNLLKAFSPVMLSILLSCGQQRDAGNTSSIADSTITKSPFIDTTFLSGKSTTTISTDIEKLGKLLNFETFKPSKVMFKYVYNINSGQNEGKSNPGPSNYSLQALLYFDSLTFEKFYDFDRSADYPSPNYTKEEFKFDWLDMEILTELEKSNPNYHGHPDFFFGTTNGKSWYLHKKILFQTGTN